MIALASEPVKNHVMGEILNPKYQIPNNSEIQNSKIEMIIEMQMFRCQSYAILSLGFGV
jgi:hypothetical protein